MSTKATDLKELIKVLAGSIRSSLNQKGAISAQTKNSWIAQLHGISKSIDPPSDDLDQLKADDAGIDFDSLTPVEASSRCADILSQQIGNDYVMVNRQLVTKLCAITASSSDFNADGNSTHGCHSILSSNISALSKVECAITALAQEIVSLKETKTTISAEVTDDQPVSTFATMAAKAMTTRAVRRLQREENPNLKPEVQNRRQAAKATRTIRVKPSENGTSIDQLLKGITLPSEVKFINSRTLEDGSKVIYANAQHEDGIRNLLSTVENVTVLKPMTFLPKIKVRSVQSSTEASAIESALEATHSRLLRTIKRNNENDFIFEVDPATYGRLTSSRLYMPSGFVSYTVLRHTDVPICTHCLTPGHSAEKCSMKNKIKKPLCAKCGKDDHFSSACTATTLCCINCQRSNKSDLNHSAFNQKKCPILVNNAKWRLSHTDYGQ